MGAVPLHYYDKRTNYNRYAQGESEEEVIHPVTRDLSFWSIRKVQIPKFLFLFDHHKQVPNCKF